MKKSPMDSEKSEIRRRAEETLGNRTEGEEEASKLPPEAIKHILHELRVHQIQLEMQNDELRRIQGELEGARDKYFHLFDFSPVGYFTLSDKGFIEEVNLTGAVMVNMVRSALIARPFTSLISKEDQNKFYLFRQLVLETEIPQSIEIRMEKNDGSDFFVNLTCLTVKNENGDHRQIRATVTDITRHIQVEAGLRQDKEELESRVMERTAGLSAAHIELRKRADLLTRLSSNLTLAEERESRRLAEIVHDHLQQLIVAAKMNLEIMNVNAQPDQRHGIGKAIALLGQSLQVSKSLTAELSPPVNPKDNFYDALQWLTKWFLENHDLKVELRADPLLALEKEDVAVLLFKAVRELLFNIIKHSGVKSGQITAVRDEENNLRIAVSDQGVGFCIQRVQQTIGCSGRFGLHTIEERLSLVGGRFEIESKPGIGTSFSMILPSDKIDPAERKPAGEAEIIEPVPSDPPILESGNKIRVILADDHAVIREGLSALLADEADIAVVAEARDGEEAVQQARELWPDVILMDISMPKINGVEATRIIHSELPHTRIIGLSMHEDPDIHMAMLDAGASVYLTKGGTSDALLAAVRSRQGQKRKKSGCQDVNPDLR